MIKVKIGEEEDGAIVEFTHPFSAHFSTNKDDEKQDKVRKEADGKAAAEMLGHLGRNSGIRETYDHKGIQYAKLTKSGLKKFKKFILKFPNVKVI